MGGSAYIATRIAAPGVIEHTGTMARLRVRPHWPSQRTRRRGVSRRLPGRRHQRRAVRRHRARASGRSSCFLVGVSQRDRGDARAARGCARRPRPALAVRAGDARDLAPGARARRRARRRLRREAASRSRRRCRPRCAPRWPHDLEAGGRLEAPWLCGAVARMSARGRARRAGEPRGLRRAQALREWICKQSCLTPGSTVLLYGTTPPRLGTAPEQVAGRRRQARRAPRRAAARRRGALRHPGRDRPHRAAAPVPLRRHGRPARATRSSSACRRSSTRRSA